MLVFVPMAGFGERYRRAGHTAAKPLITVDDRPMIEHVLRDLSPLHPSDRLLIAINREHAQTTPLIAELARLAPAAEVAIIEPHRDGPVRTLLAVADRIDANEELLLSYCDFGVRWSLPAFLEWCRAGRWDAAMSAYRGFHPHSLGPTLYAYMRTEEDPASAPGAHVQEIREKHHFTPNRMDEYASAGLFWFRRAGALLEASRAIVAEGERAAGEFYVSTAVQRQIAAGDRVGAYPLERFFQWGTAEDLEDWTGWARAMRCLDAFVEDVAGISTRSVLIVPMAGRGQRFVDEGLGVHKPMIDVGGAPMVEQTLAFLPKPSARVLVVRDSLGEDATFRAMVSALPGPTEIVPVPAVTNGQATSAWLGVARAPRGAPVLVASCDAGYLYDPAVLRVLEQDDGPDVAVFSAPSYLPARWRPEMYGWLVANPASRVEAVSVKKVVPGVDLRLQETLTGTFWFRSAALFNELYEALIGSGETVRGEFYIDTMIRQAVARQLDVRAIHVEKFIPWGTPNELSTFIYWNMVFRGGRPLRSGKAA